MAKMKRNIGDYVSGKLGNLVFVQNQGKSYVRSAPKPPKNGWSDLQVLYRQRMSNVSAMWRAISCEKIKKIWRLANPRLSSYVLFVKKNMPALAISGELMDPALIFVSEGKLHIPQLKTTTDFFQPGQITVSWENDKNISNRRLTDQLMVMSFENPVFSNPISTGIIRKDTTGIVTIPKPDTLSDPSHVFFFFESSDESQYSVSQSFTLNPVI